MINNQNEEHAKVLDYNNNRGAGAFESTIDQYVPIDEFTNNAMIDDDCPILDAMEKRCRAVNLLSNDVHQQFLPLCGVHQLCYLCVSTYINIQTSGWWILCIIIMQIPHVQLCRAPLKRPATTSTWRRWAPFVRTTRIARWPPERLWWCCAIRPARRLARVSVHAIHAWSVLWWTWRHCKMIGVVSMVDLYFLRILRASFDALASCDTIYHYIYCHIIREGGLPERQGIFDEQIDVCTACLNIFDAHYDAILVRR